MDQFADDDDDVGGDKKGRFMNSKNTGNLNKFKRDKNAPVSKADDKPNAEVKVFKPTGKVTLGSKWETEEETDKQLAAEKLKMLDEQAEHEEPKAQVKKESKFTGKANITDKTKAFDDEEKERQRLAQEKLALMDNETQKTNVKIELVKDQPKASKFTNSKKDVNNNFKKPKVDETEDKHVSSSKNTNDNKKAKDAVPSIVSAPTSIVTANKW